MLRLYDLTVYVTAAWILLSVKLTEACGMDLSRLESLLESSFIVQLLYIGRTLFFLAVIGLLGLLLAQLFFANRYREVEALHLHLQVMTNHTFLAVILSLVGGEVAYRTGSPRLGAALVAVLFYVFWVLLITVACRGVIAYRRRSGGLR